MSSAVSFSWALTVAARTSNRVSTRPDFMDTIMHDSFAALIRTVQCTRIVEPCKRESSVRGGFDLLSRGRKSTVDDRLRLSGSKENQVSLVHLASCSFSLKHPRRKAGEFLCAPVFIAPQCCPPFPPRK